ncbi:hypothetical protein RHSIM_Rhsim10G0122700 [Rhododendron simsii]|uniref:Myb/SANT-like domain-containing protein n=1 Tax=Rhododendron simsii TaxID=118357 RepID=A0A834GA00_RHOSS|nr:hypothetical protein RHSIM_Rhsim10G0122700 [Rhododendron simsii]
MQPPPPQPDEDDEYIDVVEASVQWSEWRAPLANQMFNEWQANRGQNGMSKRSGKQPRRFWSKREEEFLISCMRDLVNEDSKGKLDCGQIKAGFYGEGEKRIIRAFPGTNLRAHPHIDSKIKAWRKQYHLLQDMLKLSGFGWDDTEKMILVDSDDVWENFVRIFKANGDLAEGPADAMAAMEREAATEELGDESPTSGLGTSFMDYSMPEGPNVGKSHGGQSSVPPSSVPPSSNVAGKKRKRVADGIAKGLSDMAEAFGTFFENSNTRMAEIGHRIGYAQDLSLQRKQVNAELMDHPLDWEQWLRAATLIVQEPQRVDLFFSFPKEDQVGWVALLLAGAI